MHSRILGGIAIGLAVSTAASACGVIRGTLRVPPPQAAASTSNPYPGQAGSIAGAHGAGRGLVGDAVIYVERVPGGGDSATMAAPVPKLSQKGQAFVPRVLAVAAGGSVDFPNLDPIFHNAFSLSPARRFDLGKYPRGHSKRVRFPRAGLVHVFCDIHSDMAAFILVLPHHAFAQPDDEGRWALPALPPGRYTLHAWHPDLRELTREIELPAHGGLTVALDF